MAPLEAATEGMLIVATQPLHAIMRYSHFTHFLLHSLSSSTSPSNYFVIEMHLIGLLEALPRRHPHIAAANRARPWFWPA